MAFLVLGKKGSLTTCTALFQGNLSKPGVWNWTRSFSFPILRSLCAYIAHTVLNLICCLSNLFGFCWFQKCSIDPSQVSSFGNCSSQWQTIILHQWQGLSTFGPPSHVATQYPLMSLVQNYLPLWQLPSSAVLQDHFPSPQSFLTAASFLSRWIPTVKMEERTEWAKIAPVPTNHYSLSIFAFVNLVWWNSSIM